MTGNAENQPGQGSPGARSPREPHWGLIFGGVLGVAVLGGLIAGFATTGTHETPNSAAASAAHPAHPYGGYAASSTPTSSISAPSNHLLTKLTGVGARTSAPFRVTSSPVTVRYSYRCPFGSQRFSASLSSASGASVQPVADSTSAGVSAVSTVKPTAVGGDYKISADSSCPYTVEAFSPL